MAETATIDSTIAVYGHLLDMAEPIYELGDIVSLLTALTLSDEIDPVALRPVREAIDRARCRLEASRDAGANALHASVKWPSGRPVAKKEGAQ